MHQNDTNSSLFVLNHKENGLFSLFRVNSASDSTNKPQKSQNTPEKLCLEATSTKWDLARIISVCSVLWIEIIAVIGILFLILLVSGILRHFFQGICMLFAPIQEIEIAVRILETWSFCYGILKLMSYFFQIEMKKIVNRLGFMGWNQSIISSLLLFSLWYGWILLFCTGFFMPQELGELKGLVSWSFFWKNLKNFGPSTPAGSNGSSKLLSNGLEIFILAPLKEELVFRGLLYHIVLNRMESTVLSGAIANGLFGLVHLVNLYKSSSTSTSHLYTFFQVLLSILIGFFYTLRQEKTKKPMVDNIFLHIQHNFFATFYTKEYPVLQDKMNQRFLLLLISCIQTLGFYGCCVWWTYTRPQDVIVHEQDKEDQRKKE